LSFHRRQLALLTDTPSHSWNKTLTALSGSGTEQSSTFLQTLDVYHSLSALTVKSAQNTSALAGAKLALASTLDATTAMLETPLKAGDLLVFAPNQSPIAIRNLRSQDVKHLSAFLANSISPLQNTPFREMDSSIFRAPPLFQPKESTESAFPFQVTNLSLTPKLPHSHVLVCCHAQRDERCGLHGTLILSAVRDIIAKNRNAKHQSTGQEISAADVWNSLNAFGVSHVGGHEFAGNVIFYPSASWFGLIRSADEARDLLQAYVRAVLVANTSSVPFESAFTREIPKAHWRSPCPNCS
jgi:hypothetical protein